MRVYIAAPWICKDAARDAAVLFSDAGFVITKRWWDHREVPGYLEHDDHIEELRQQAREDFEGVLTADLFVLLNLSKSEGKAVETGIALTWGIPIILVGGKSNLFHYTPNIDEARSVEHAIEIAESYGR